jgi:hypothetical protein
MKKAVLLTLFLAYGLYFTINAQVKNIDLTVKENNVRITWIKDSDNVRYFEVERRPAQTGTWLTAGKYYAGNKTKFSFSNSNLKGQKYFYRIKSVYKDGGSSYSGLIEANTNNPFGFALDQNYPNPFNPETAIKFSIPEAGYVDLRIYNLLGQEVQTLVSEYRDAGEYTVRFMADELNSGLYIYKLISGENVLTKKMTLVK